MSGRTSLLREAAHPSQAGERTRAAVQRQPIRFLMKIAPHGKRSVVHIDIRLSILDAQYKAYARDEIASFPQHADEENQLAAHHHSRLY